MESVIIIFYLDISIDILVYIIILQYTGFIFCVCAYIYTHTHTKLFKIPWKKIRSHAQYYCKTSVLILIN